MPAAPVSLPPSAPEDRPAFAALVESLPDPVLVVAAHDADDPTDRRITFANRAARELLRIQAEGAPLVSALRHPRVLEAADESLFGRQQGEAAYETGGAQDRYWRILTRPLDDLANGARQALLVMRDETDSRRNERMRADFLANASHELRTPLASLSGFIETLRGHARDDATARDRFLGIMQVQAGRMARLIDDLMSLSRIELAEHIVPADRVDVAACVQDVVEACAPMAERTGVALKVKLPRKGAALVAGDRDQIVQVVQNLVDNAIKYSTPGKPVELVLQAGLSPEA